MENTKQATELFDKLKTETIYSFNMKCILQAMMDDDSETIEALKRLIRRCQQEREAIREKHKEILA